MSFARSDLKALVGCERGRVGRVLPHSMRTANNATKTRCKRGHVRRALNYTTYYATFESSYQCKTRHVQHIINYNTRIKITRMFKVITHGTPHQHTTHTVSSHAKSPKTTPHKKLAASNRLQFDTASTCTRVRSSYSPGTIDTIRGAFTITLRGATPPKRSTIAGKANA